MKHLLLAVCLAAISLCHGCTGGTAPEPRKNEPFDVNPEPEQSIPAGVHP